MTAGRQETEVRSNSLRREAIIFDLVLLGFATLIVITALGLRPGPRLVPLVIGIPVMLGMALVTVTDLLRPSESSTEQGEETEVMPSDLGSARLATLAGMAAREMAEDSLMPMDEESVRKRRVFTLWAVAVFLLAWVTSFYVAMTLGLIVIYRYVRIPWFQTILVTTVLVGMVYTTFDVLLGVRF